MRILFLSTNLPIPTTNGQSMRTLSIIQSLASSGHQLSFVSFARKNKPDSMQPLASYCLEIDLLNMEINNVSQASDYWRRVLCLLTLRSYSIERFRSDQMQEQLRRRLEAGRFDAIVCDGLYALINVPTSRIPIILNCHNVEHLIFRRYSQIELNPLKKFYAALEAHCLRGIERNSCRRVAMAMVCSETDARTLHQLCSDLPIFVVPNVIDTDLYQVAGASSSHIALLFHGGMDWYPNRDAVRLFAQTILPTIRTELSDVRFIVAGRNPPAEFVRELSAKYGVEFTGTVPDIRPYLDRATVVVVPMRVGSGTRIKILEACAAGKPVVATRIGAEGLDLQDGRDIVLADNPIEFAQAVLSLLRDHERRAAISRSARATIVTNYGLPRLKRSLDEVLSSVA